jgi:multidrug efflux pump subunit AcrB
MSVGYFLLFFLSRYLSYAFNFFYYAGISVNSLTLVGMALAVGMFLDNSIVVLKISTGCPARHAPASRLSWNQRGVAFDCGGNLYTVIVFLPFIFRIIFCSTHGKPYRCIDHLYLLVSLAVALLFVPMTTYLVLRSKKDESFL